MSTFEYDGIVSTATVNLLAKAELKEPKGIALALSESGAALPTAGADVAGIAVISNPDTVAAGGRVDVQIKDVGLWRAGEEFEAGALLATDATGKAVKAKTGNYIVARALEAASAADDLVKVQMLNAGAKA